MTTGKTHYDVLGVRMDASNDAIKRAYRDLIRRYHPDQFVAEHSRLKADGNVSALHALEREIEAAHKRTQSINSAYAVLSDPTARTRYDQTLKPKPAAPRFNRSATYQHPADTRRTVKQRPHQRRQQRTRADDAIPFVLLGVLFVGLLAGSALISDFFGFSSAPSVTLPEAATSRPGFTSAFDLQATTSAEQATIAARLEKLAQPTATPRGIQASVSSADAFLELESYELAVEGYTEAIARDDTNAELYFKRGQAYGGLYYTDNDDTRPYVQALIDYARALELDAAFYPVLRERGLLHFEHYRLTGDATAESGARNDLSAYVQLTASQEDDAVISALAILNQE